MVCLVSGGFWRAKLTIEDPFPKRLQDNYLRASFNALLGEEEEAIDALTVAMERRPPMIVFARINIFSSLRESSTQEACVPSLDQGQQFFFTQNAGGLLGPIVNAIDALITRFDTASLEPEDHVRLAAHRPNIDHLLQTELSGGHA